MNRSRIGNDFGELEITDDIDHAAVTFNLDARALRHPEGNVYPIIIVSFADIYCVAINPHVTSCHRRAGRSSLQTHLLF